MADHPPAAPDVPATLTPLNPLPDGVLECFSEHERLILNHLMCVAEKAYTDNYTGVPSDAMSAFKEYIEPQHILRISEVMRALWLRTAAAQRDAARKESR